jgi:putative glutamine amidotransferase
VEAIHAPSLSPFLFAVQWHPEWQAAQNPDSVKIFQAFGEACRRQVEGKARGKTFHNAA